jgi:hypothetical protein
MWVRGAEFATSIPDGAGSLQDGMGQEFLPDTAWFEAWETFDSFSLQCVVFGTRENGAGRTNATLFPPFPTWLPEPPLWWADAVAWVEGQE